MTRLFLRFYLGVVAILISAWAIQSYVFRQRSEAENIRVIEQALSGGARLARDELASSSPQQGPDAFARIQQRFDYPVQVFDLGADWLSEPSRNRLVGDEVVFLGSHIAIASPTAQQDDSRRAADESWGLLFGPLPQFVGPSQTEITFGYGGVFILAAIAIAILLRPVASQLRAVEQTAAAIAHGDLSARIDGTQAPKGLALVRAFNSMADRTETSLRSQSELLQAVSHELRTPLARIRFATDLVESAQSDDERRTRLDAIDDATEKLDGLVGELLTYVRLESSPSEPAPESVDLQALFSELVEIHAPLTPSAEFAIEPSAEPIRLSADRDSLSRAIENLLSNAGRFARQRVSVHAVKHPDHVVIHVDDDGPGIAESDREKVLEPFVRLDNSSQRGSGLGLAIVNRIAKRHGGQLMVSDSPLGGARFSLMIPSS